MSQPQYGNDMDRSATGDIIRRARERAEAGLPREDYETFLRRQQAERQQAELSNSSGSPSTPTPDIPPRNRPPQGSPDSAGPPRQRLQAPPGFQGKDGQLALPISRPAPVPQWPLAGPLATPSTPSDAEPYRPPAGSSPPQRPPRPSHVPSILDGSKIQDPTPSFQYQAQRDRDSDYISSSVPETPSTLSRPSTLSSVASIPDFPLPIQAPPPPAMGPPRRSVTLGPPPSARRGASSFYSHLSYVSPIPEESPRSRSHTSYASSAAMPENWGTPSPIDSTRYNEVYYDETVTEPDEPSPASVQSMHFDDEGDESRLVRNASVGRRGKAALVTTLTPTAQRDASRSSENSPERPGAAPVQPGPFVSGTGFLEASSNSSTTVPTLSTGRTQPSMAAPSAEDMIIAFDAASAMDPRASRRVSELNNNGEADKRFSRGFSRLSAIRRPPRLDIDAVRNAETRGSLTSLPDLIRRATRLAASLDKGRRPASRFDLDDFPPEFYGAGNTSKLANVETVDSDEYYDDKHRSGLSDMLAAFPPPAQANSRTGIRQSLRDSVLSWPLPPLNNNNGNGFGTPRGGQGGPGGYSSRGSTPEDEKKGRRCCGLPLWGFILIVIIILILVAAAVIIPIEFFVIRRNNAAANTTAAADQQCQNQLTCQNGGTNVVTNGICSCICSNGFTGFDCSTSDSAGCTTTTVSGATNINNVTLGDAIPRLLTEASTNFTIPLSDTAIIGKLNAGNLSCTSQNALVTFNGNDASAVSNVALADSLENNVVEAAAVGIATLTIMAGQSTTTTLTIGLSSLSPTTTITITRTMTTDWLPSTTSTLAPTTTPLSISTATTATSAPATTTPSTTFTVSQQALDFARVGVLLILQQDSLTEATTAQSSLQTFFTSAATGATIAAASNVSLSNGNSIDLVNFKIDAGAGLVGSLVTSTKRDLEGMSFDLWA